MNRKMAVPSRTAGALVAGALAVAACGDAPATPPEPPPRPEAASIELATDTAALWGYVRAATVEPLVVEVGDRAGNPVSGALVNFAAADGGLANPAQATTDRDGRAATTWTLGPEPGTYSMTVRAGSADPLVVFATTRPLLELEADTLIVMTSDTTLHVAANVPPGREWTARVAQEDRWLDDAPVVEVRTLPEPPRVELRVRSPGTAQVSVETGQTSHAFLLVVAPAQPVVLEIDQPDWPSSQEAVLRGYNMHHLPFTGIQVDGEPVALAYQDSAEVIIRAAPLGRGACSGPAAAPGVVSIVGGAVVTDPVVMRAGGPLISLALGESKRLDSNDTCLRMLLPPDARIAVAGVDRSFVDRAQAEAEAVTYDEQPLYTVFMADSTPAARFSASLRREAGASSRNTVHHHLPPDIVPYRPSAALATANVYTQTEPYAVGDEFEWFTNNGRRGTYRIMALYPPNVALAVFKDDLPALWNDARKAAMDSLFLDLASDDVQGMYKNIFGPNPPATSPATGQMLVMFHDGSDGEGTGVNNPYWTDNRYSTIHFRRVHFQDDNGWYRNLVSHEFAHAWQFANIQGFSAVWSIEGIANFFAEEFIRISGGLSLDANHDYDQPVRNWKFRLPTTGSFVSGYRESHPFLRHLVERLVLVHGQDYERSVRRVVRGAALGWHGRHFVRWGSEESMQGQGLVAQMQEVVPAWDPVEARLDWMLSIALDDRASFGEYGVAFVRDAWRQFGPVQHIRVGDGREWSVTATRAGNLYYVLVGGPEPASVRLRVASGEPEMAYKVVRFK